MYEVIVIDQSLTSIPPMLCTALQLPTEDYFSPLDVPIHTLDQRFEYRWKAYAISESDLQDVIAGHMHAAQMQMLENLQAAVEDGWQPVYTFQYPHILIPSIRKYSTKLFIRYNGLILCCKPKALGLEAPWKYAFAKIANICTDIHKNYYTSDGGTYSLGSTLKLEY